MSLSRKPNLSLFPLVDPLSQVTAHQDDSHLSGNTRWLLRNGRACCVRAKLVDCDCLQSIVCDLHGRHCLGPHDWSGFFRAGDEAA